MSNLPPGAEDDTSAPWYNQEDIGRYKRMRIRAEREYEPEEDVEPNQEEENETD
jgi:hypothetical protein